MTAKRSREINRETIHVSNGAILLSSFVSVFPWRPWRLGGSSRQLITDEGVVLSGVAELAAAGAGVPDGVDRCRFTAVHCFFGGDLYVDGRLEHAQLALAVSSGTDLLAMGR